jgi:anti-sigma factor RsiW
MDGEKDVGGLRCREVLALLSDFLDDALDEPRRVQVVAHVSGCDNCARFGGAFTAAVGALRGLAREPDASSGA